MGAQANLTLVLQQFIRNKVYISNLNYKRVLNVLNSRADHFFTTHGKLGVFAIMHSVCTAEINS